jgi:ribonuclease G
MNELIINVDPLETRIARLEEKRLAELHVERHGERSLVGNVYRGRVDSIVPGIQAAFVDIGQERNGFLYVADIADKEGGADVDLDDLEGGGRRKHRRLGIEKILKRGQHIMVQVQKDTLGTKGVRLTNYVTLPGRYVVLMPTVSQIGVSRKIEDQKERDRLKKILRNFRKNRPYGLILRTAGENKSEEELLADLKYLNKQWDLIKKAMDESDEKKSVLLHEDLDSVLRTVRDTFTEDVSRLTIDSQPALDGIIEFLDVYATGLKKRCRVYTGRRPIFDRMGIEEQIEKALERRVELKSGGSIVIDHTEALTAIDVNTGRFTGKKQLEDTVFKTNMEAADEIAHQMRLRDLGGIIVVDFIDMEQEANRRKLLQKCRELVKKDRARITISDIGELGMVEMTRKRVKHNLTRQLSQHCPYCDGTGSVRSVTTLTSDVLRRLRALFCRSKEKGIVVQLHPDLARRLRSENKDLLDQVAAEFDRQIAIESVSDLHIEEIKVISARTRKFIEDLSVRKRPAS